MVVGVVMLCDGAPPARPGDGTGHSWSRLRA